jgi:hypothetical protein
VNYYHFEIVRRTYRSFSWLLVEGEGRVVAHSERDWRSKHKVKRAIGRLKEMVAGADVVDGTGSSDPYDLPKTSFELTPYALPLLVGETTEYLTAASAAGQRRYRAPKRGSKPTNGKAYRAREPAERVSAGTASDLASAEQPSSGQAPAEEATRGDTASTRPSSGTTRRTTRRASGTKKAAESDAANKTAPGSATDRRSGGGRGR